MLVHQRYLLATDFNIMQQLHGMLVIANLLVLHTFNLIPCC